MQRTRPRTLPPMLAGAATLLALAVLAPTAGAATATTKAATKTATATKPGAGIFCAQLRNSQAAIATVPTTAKDRLARIAAEWTKIDRFAPASIKKDTAAILTAYRKAATQSASDAKATLAAIAASGQRVTTFATTGCPSTASGTRGGPGGPGGPGGMSDAERAKRLAELQACMKKQGVAVPDLKALGRGPRGAGAAPAATLPAKTQSALAACGFGPGGGDGRRGGGLRALADNPQLQACVKSKGVTLPSLPAAGQAGGQRAQLDDKTRAALQACRDQLGLGGPGGPGGQAPATTVSPTPSTTAAATTAAPTTTVAA